jgi:hypothetical protein
MDRRHVQPVVGVACVSLLRAPGATPMPWQNATGITVSGTATVVAGASSRTTTGESRVRGIGERRGRAAATSLPKCVPRFEDAQPCREGDARSARSSATSGRRLRYGGQLPPDPPVEKRLLLAPLVGISAELLDEGTPPQRRGSHLATPTPSPPPSGGLLAPTRRPTMTQPMPPRSSGLRFGRPLTKRLPRSGSAEMNRVLAGISRSRSARNENRLFSIEAPIQMFPGQA